MYRECLRRNWTWGVRHWSLHVKTLPLVTPHNVRFVVTTKAASKTYDADDAVGSSKPSATPSVRALVVVESPAKAKTIKKYLPKDYDVDACLGSIRDLPQSRKDIPAKYKKEKWASLGIDIENDFAPLYIVPAAKKKVVETLKKKLASAKELILATDEDREGEGISWQLVETLKPRIPVKRMVFHEITPEAITQAMHAFRDIDTNLVQAQEARRLIDRLAGFTVSPLLWTKIAPGLSAGRVQSVAVNVLVQREEQRMQFRSAQYWDLSAELALARDPLRPFTATLSHLNAVRVASGKDFDSTTGLVKGDKDRVVVLDEPAARDLADRLERSCVVLTVESVETKPQTRTPSPPFITSTLQQEANRKLGYAAKETMRIAQQLYEDGHITYMRTDSVHLSHQACEAARECVSREYGADLLPPAPRQYKGKAKNAQEAHEAIRPAVKDGAFQLPDAADLEGRPLRIYRLIFTRTIASQMADAKLDLTSAVITARDDALEATFRASGKVVVFPGFLRAYEESTDEDDDARKGRSDDERLPAMNVGDAVTAPKVDAVRHETKPPARYTEAALVKDLEKHGIGRPSTYATIISTILDREYCIKDPKSGALVPTFTAFAVTALLRKHIPEMVSTRFTSEMEEKLDAIACGDEDRTAYLRAYYSGENGLQKRVQATEPAINAQEARRIQFDVPKLDRPVSVSVGKYGAYIQADVDGEKVSAALPVTCTPGELSAELVGHLLDALDKGPTAVGEDPATALPVYALLGKYGPYVQLGDKTEENPSPKRARLLQGQTLADMDLPTALRLLSLPRLLGLHPETGKEVMAQVGPFGPYVTHDEVNKALPATDGVFTIELARAVELLNTSTIKMVADLGTHPVSGKPVRIMTGRFGPFVRHGNDKLALPAGVAPDAATHDLVFSAIDARLASKKKTKASTSLRTKKSATSTSAASDASDGAAPSKVKATATRRKKPATVPIVTAQDSKGAPSASAVEEAASVPKTTRVRRKRESTPEPSVLATEADGSASVALIAEPSPRRTRRSSQGRESDMSGVAADPPTATATAGAPASSPTRGRRKAQPPAP